MFVRVKDRQTGHQFDVPEDSRLVRDGVVQVLGRFEKSPACRPAKPKIRPQSGPPMNEPSHSESVQALADRLS